MINKSDNIYIRNSVITLSSCDAKGELSITGALDIFMDMASLHEEKIGCSIVDMQKEGLFWIIGNHRLEFLEKPKLMDKVILSTWIDKPLKNISNRNYLITNKEGKILVKASTQWLIANTGLKKLYKITDILKTDLDYSKESVFNDKVKNIQKDFSNAQIIGEYTVKPTDIDYIGHMNNAAYSRCLLNLIPNYDLSKNPVKEAVFFYHKQCLENDKLTIYKRQIENPSYIEEEYGALKNGEIVLTARLLRENNK